MASQKANTLSTVHSGTVDFGTVSFGTADSAGAVLASVPTLVPRGAGAAKSRIGTQPSSIHFRELDINWVERIYALEQICFSCQWSLDLMRKEFRNEISFIPGLISSGELVGYSFSHIVCDELHVLSLAVAPCYRTKGYGKAILGYLLLEGILRGVRDVVLEVRVGNAVARNLYSSMGFHVLGIRRGYYQDNGEDALVLGRGLAPKDAQALGAFALEAIDR